jgi:P-type E1-E2 ATPase
LIEIIVPGWKHLTLAVLVLDVNGVLAVDGQLLAGVSEHLSQLNHQLVIHLLSADTHGRLDDVKARLAVSGHRLNPVGNEVEQKARFVREIGADGVVAIGNGANDVGMLQEATLGICVLGPEGLAATTIAASDLVVGSIHDALDLLAHPKRVMATLRR